MADELRDAGVQASSKVAVAVRTPLEVRGNLSWSRTRRFFADHPQGDLIGDCLRPEPRVHQLRRPHEVHDDLFPLLSPVAPGRRGAMDLDWRVSYRR